MFVYYYDELDAPKVKAFLKCVLTKYKKMIDTSVQCNSRIKSGNALYYSFQNTHTLSSRPLFETW
jgi:hypothetical protein